MADRYGTDELADLYRSWQGAFDRHRVLDDDDTLVEEQHTRDALVDYVEAHDLNYSQWDPRGRKS